MPSKELKPVFSIGFNESTEEYEKGIPGTYDASVFTDPDTGKFRLPDYNAKRTGLVKIKDTTNYRSFFRNYSKKQLDNLSIEDFELNFSSPSFLVEHFADFMDRFPDECFNKGISRSQIFRLFNEFRQYLLFRKDSRKDVFYLPDEQVREAITLGLFKKVDPAKDPAKHWSHFKLVTLQEYCTKNGIKCGSAKPTNIKRLIEKNVPFPLIPVIPTPLFSETYWSFIDMYINDLREQIDRFHPLYIYYFWQIARNQHREPGVPERIVELLTPPSYWTSRLTTGTKILNK